MVRHIVGQLVVGPGAVDSATQHGHGGASGGQRSTMGSGIHAPREARDDRETCSRELVCEAFGLGFAIGRGGTTANDADPRCVREDIQIAANPELIGRSLDVGQFSGPARPAGA